MAFFKTFLRERMYPVMWGVCTVAGCVLVFWLYNMPMEAILYAVLLCVAGGLAVGVVDFIRELRKHRVRMRCVATAQYDRGLLPEEQGMAGQDYAQLLDALWERIDTLEEKSNAEKREARDYYTTWVHQIKTPLSVMQMLVKTEDTETNRAIATELFRTESYVDMALGYIRLGDDSNDLVIRECDLDELVRASIRRFAPQFIARKLTLNYEPNKVKVVTDGKWFSFLLEQLLSNAVKYTYEGGVTITLTEDAKVIVRDTGIGIAPEDVPRIFDKGYTGFNGRLAGNASGERSTGLGLYLCNKIAHKLEVGLSVESEIGKGSTFTIDMHKDAVVVE